MVLPVLALAIKMYRWTYTYKVDDRAIHPNAIETLGLNLEEIGKIYLNDYDQEYRSYLSQRLPKEPFTLRQAAQEVIKEINVRHSIEKEKPFQHQSAFYQGRTQLRIFSGVHKDRSNLCFYEILPNYTDSIGQKSWMHRILNALVEKKYIQSFEYAQYYDGYLIKI